MENSLIKIIVNSSTSPLPLLSSFSFFCSRSRLCKVSHVCWHVPILPGCSAKDVNLRAASFPPQTLHVLQAVPCTHTHSNFLISVPRAVRPSCSTQKAVFHHLHHMQDKPSNLRSYSSSIFRGTVSSHHFQNLTFHFTVVHVSSNTRMTSMA